MFGAIAGDVIGSTYEFNNVDSMDFELFPEGSTFTDDTVLTCAVAEALMNNTPIASSLLRWGLKYPKAGYGDMFVKWLLDPKLECYGSWGNGAIMRCSPAGWVGLTSSGCALLGRLSAEPTHIEDACLMAMYVAKIIHGLREGGYSRINVWQDVPQKWFPTDFIETTRKTYEFTEKCSETLPVAIEAFIESTDWENAIRLACYVGGDTDTICAVTGAFAEAYYGEVPEAIAAEVMARLPNEMIALIERFQGLYGGTYHGKSH